MDNSELLNCWVLLNVRTQRHGNSLKERKNRGRWFIRKTAFMVRQSELKAWSPIMQLPQSPISATRWLPHLRIGNKNISVLGFELLNNMEQCLGHLKMLNLKVQFHDEHETLIEKHCVYKTLSFSYVVVCILVLKLMYSCMCLAHGGYSINVEWENSGLNRNLEIQLEI